jgi:hypothetical protein
MPVCLWLNPLYNFVLQAIQNEREIESLRKKLTFCVESKENLERYNYFTTLACCHEEFYRFIINMFPSSIVCFDTNDLKMVNVISDSFLLCCL